MYFKNVDLTDLQNPLKYFCAPNEATYDYVPAHDLVDFIKAGFFHCYIPQEDIAVQYNAKDICYVREDFLQCLELVLLTMTLDHIPLWQEAFHQDVDFYNPEGGVWLEFAEDNIDDYQVIWIFKGTEPSDYDKKLNVLRFHCAWDLDEEVYWLCSDAIESLDIDNIKSIINEARKINQDILKSI